MSRFPHFECLALLTVCAVGSSELWAQLDPVTPRPASDAVVRDQPAFVFLDKVVGAKVILQASAEEKSEAAQDGEAPDRPSGEVKDVIISTSDGCVGWAVVSVGGFLGIGEKNVAVPCDELNRSVRDDGDEVTFTLTASKAELEALPRFDIGDAKKQGLDRAVQAVEASWPRDGERPSNEPAREPGSAGAYREGEGAMAKRSAVVPVQMILGSEVDDYSVVAGGEEFGSVDDAIVEISQKRLTHFVVARGGVLGVGDTKYLIPVSGTALTKRGDEFVWAVDKTVQQIEEGGIKYEKPAHGVLDVDVCRRADAFFGVEKAHDGAKMKPGHQSPDNRRGK